MRATVTRTLALGVTIMLAVATLGLVSAPGVYAATPAFVQGANRETTSGTTNAVAFPNANTAGNLIAVYVVWSNTGAVTLSDTKNNTYGAATARISWGFGWSAQVFYAANIGAGSNTVKATFGTAISSFAIVYLHEYSGLNKTNPVDVTKSAIGTTSAMSSGAVTTTNAADLLFTPGASNNAVTQGGIGFTTRSMAQGNITQDRSVTTTGSYVGTAVQDGQSWVMQLVAFRAAAATADTTPPTVPTGLTATATSTSQINLSWTASTDNVGVTGYKIFRNGILVATSTTPSYQNTGLASATTYTYVVSAFDAAGNNSAQSTTASAKTLSPSDTTAPTVSLTAPAAGATVSGSVVVSANASDNIGVVGVQFLLDGNNLGAEDTTPPYSTSWDTTAVVNGSHALTARARDAATNTKTSTAVNVTVSNTVTPPAAAYAFDAGTGTTAADASGHSLNGTLVNGPIWAPGKYGSAVSFDGVDDFVDLGNPAALQMTGSMTISAWINSASFPADDAAVVSKRASDGVGYQLDTTIDSGPRRIGFKLTNSSGVDMIRYGATTLQLNTWYHIAGVYNAATQAIDVFLNGVLDDGVLLGTVTSSQQNSSSNVNIGERAGTSAFNGRIDDVRIYNRTQTAAEIQADGNSPLGGTSTDTTAPAVAITSPSNNAQVHDIVTVTADADDNVGVSGVQFFVDGVASGTEDTVAPYGLSWDTRTATNGAHTLTATARDAAGNTRTSASVAVNVANTNSFQNEVLATGLALPTSMKFLPDGRMLVAELQGKIKVLSPPYVQPDPTPFLQITNIGAGGSGGAQEGIFDFALDPNFATNHFYYVFYTLATPNRDRLSRFTANATNTATVPGSEFVLYQDPQDANTEHHGGAINFGNDGKLYFTTGEHFNPPDAQSLDNPRGKIHRINLDGTVPTDNPFYDGAGPHWDSIWAYGLRNPYRAYYDAPTGRLFVGDVGGNDPSTAQEELNVGAAGANYGWPNSEGPCAAPCTSPIYSYPHNGRDAAITAGFVYHGSQFPSAYQGNFFFADYAQNWIRRLTLDAAGKVTGVFNFEPIDGSVDGPYGDIVYMTQGPDGALYYLDLGYSDVSGTFGVSKVRRIRYAQSNQAPVAIASANPPSGPAPLGVSFSSAGSFDPEGQPVTYSWTFGDGATSTAANPAHTYTQAGQYTVRLSVSDGVNTTISTPITITAGSPPTATILSPVDGTFFRAGDVISYNGNGTDSGGATLPASAFTWTIDFLHDGHVHPGVSVTGVKSGTFTIPTIGHDFSGLTRYRITLTVTDSNGLTDTKSVTVWPTKVNLSFSTVPAGLTLYLDGIAKTTPFVYDTLVGFNHTIEAQNQSVGNTNYTFASWSDGGTQQHTLVVPNSDQSYAATYNVTTPPPAPAFVQINSTTPQTPQSTVSLPYTATQTTGNLNVVAVGWNDATSTIASVADSAGNTYQLAAPVKRGSSLSQAIYYAKNINAAAANTVTVRFASAVPWPDIRIAEYHGLDPVNPLDTTASAAGIGPNASSGTFTTTTANELIFGAGMTGGLFASGTPNFTTRLITPIDADIVIDRNVTSTGTYSADAVLDASPTWVMQAVTFRAAGP